MMDEKLDDFSYVSVKPINTPSSGSNYDMQKGRKRKPSKFQSFLNKIGYISTQEVGELRMRQEQSTKFFSKGSMGSPSKSLLGVR